MGEGCLTRYRRYVPQVRAYQLTAAVLVLCATPFLGGCAHMSSTAHTCSATDKQFIDVTQLNMNMLGYWSSDLATGESQPGEVIAETKDAAIRVDQTAPTDPSLSQTRVIVRSMLVEYWRAIAAHAHHREAGPHMMRAYGLANFAHDVLAQAAPALAAQGCNVSALL
jgi:hypothetical protein